MGAGGAGNRDVRLVRIATLSTPLTASRTVISILGSVPVAMSTSLPTVGNDMLTLMVRSVPSWAEARSVESSKVCPAERTAASWLTANAPETSPSAMDSRSVGQSSLKTRVTNLLAPPVLESSIYWIVCMIGKSANRVAVSSTAIGPSTTVRGETGGTAITVFQRFSGIRNGVSSGKVTSRSGTPVAWSRSSKAKLTTTDSATAEKKLLASGASTVSLIGSGTAPAGNWTSRKLASMRDVSSAPANCTCSSRLTLSANMVESFTTSAMV